MGKKTRDGSQALGRSILDSILVHETKVSLFLVKFFLISVNIDQIRNKLSDVCDTMYQLRAKIQAQIPFSEVYKMMNILYISVFCYPTIKNSEVCVYFNSPICTGKAFTIPRIYGSNNMIHTFRINLASTILQLLPKWLTILDIFTENCGILNILANRSFSISFGLV